MKNRTIYIGLAIAVAAIILLSFLPWQTNNPDPIYNPNPETTTGTPTGTTTGGPTNPAIKSGNFNQATTLKLAETVTFPDNLAVKLLQVNDSRCKTGQTCVWQGELAAVLYASGGKFPTAREINLGTVNNQSAVISGYSFKVKSMTEDSITFEVAKESAAVVGACYIGGCSSQICSDQKDIASTCEYREEYACYKSAKCERQPSGECGWTQTTQLTQCISKARSSGGEIVY
jgi:hypothetical protein